MTKDSDLNISFANVIRFYIKKFYSELNVIPVLGCELEFYTHNKTTEKKLSKLISDSQIKVKPEEGTNQFELLFPHTLRPFDIINSIKNVKKELEEVAIFDTKPFDNQPSNSLHIHINFLDKEGNNLFERIKNNNPEIFLHSIGGLIRFMKESCIFFAPHPRDYKRYSINSMHTPSNISWGINNRTTAIRITTIEKGARRIEHRLPSSQACPEISIALVLMSIYSGIKDKILPPDPIYGKAFDLQYGLEPLPQNIEEAQTLMMKSKISEILMESSKEAP